MKGFNPTQKKWAMVGTLLFVLGFNISVHHFQKDENGFAVIHEDMRQDLRNQGQTTQLAYKHNRNETSGTIEMASGAAAADTDKQKAIVAQLKDDPNSKLGKPAEAANDAKKEEPKKIEPKAEEPKKADAIVEPTAPKAETKAESKSVAEEAKISQTIPAPSEEALNTMKQNIIFNDGQKGTVVYIQNGQETTASISYEGCSSCGKTMVLPVKFAKDVNVLEPVLRKVMSSGGGKEEKSEVADKDNQDAKPKTKEEIKLAKEEKAKKDKIARDDKEIDTIIKECASESEKRDEMKCRADKYVDLVKDNKTREKEDRIPETKLKNFYAKNIEKDLVEMMMGGEEGILANPQDVNAGFLISRKMMGSLPSGYESIRGRLVSANLGVAQQSTYQFQMMKRDELMYVTRMKAIYPNYEEKKYLDPNYVMMTQRSMQASQVATYMNQISDFNVRNGLNTAIQTGRMLPAQSMGYFNYMNARSSAHLQALMNPSDNSHLLQPYIVGQSDMLDPLLAGYATTGTAGLMYLNGNTTQARVIDNNSAVRARSSNVTAAGATGKNSIIILDSSSNLLNSNGSLLNSNNTTLGNGTTVRRANPNALFSNGLNNGVLNNGIYNQNLNNTVLPVVK